ncbi:SGNH/GDSL hydrolase family protein, partial [Schumannella luteola]
MERKGMLLAVGVLGALAAVGVGLRAALAHQAALARRRIGKPHGDDVPRSDRIWRPRLAGEPLELLVMGDSVAAGLGAHRRKDTPGARLAKGLARATARPVELRT